MHTDESVGISRRRLLVAGGLAGVGTAVLAGCTADPPDAVAASDILAVRTNRVPVDDPSSDDWDWAPAKVVTLAEQAIALPHRPVPSVPEISVRALHDGSTLGFRLSWEDAEVNDLTVQVDGFRDACAVLLAPGAGDETLRTMGTQEQPVTLLHWKADWQRDTDHGVQGEAEIYPNRSIDTYPPLTGSTPNEVTVADYQEAGATEWLPGVHVGNPISAPTRTTPIEKLIAYGYSTATSLTTQDGQGRGERTDHGWQVVIAKPLAATETGEVALSTGGTATSAFAIWSGGDQDSGGRKSPSAVVYRLVLEP